MYTLWKSFIHDYNFYTNWILSLQDKVQCIEGGFVFFFNNECFYNSRQKKCYQFWSFVEFVVYVCYPMLCCYFLFDNDDYCCTYWKCLHNNLFSSVCVLWCILIQVNVFQVFVFFVSIQSSDLSPIPILESPLCSFGWPPTFG